MSITTELGAQKIVPGVSYLASFSTFIGSALTVNDIGIIIGIICAVATAVANWAYQARKNAREEKLAELQREILIKQLSRIKEDDR